VAEDRGLDLGEALRQLVAARRAGRVEPKRALIGRVQRTRPSPGDLLEREPQGLGVGELTVEQRQRELQKFSGRSE
jgi:hypothetical protein